MTKVKPKLYLNMSPQTTEEGSLAYARNMKIDDDGNLISDFGYNDITAMANYNIVGHIVGLNNTVYFFCSTRQVNNNVITWVDNKIVQYNELLKSRIELNTSWVYSGGTITGYASTNQSGDRILTVCEYVDGDLNIPIKHINLTHPGKIGESLYCQAPKCPTSNLILKNTYVKTIPNGVYVFFIRYKIRKDVYTNWFLCSRPIFGGTSEKINTLQGGLQYINLHKDSAKSFVFQLKFANNPIVEHYDEQTIYALNAYEEFQLGFIISYDESTNARIWKSFKLSDFVETPTNNQNLIYFDYDNVQDANIDDFLATTYELYNVKNVTSFKNKLYISNYIESDLNDVDIIGLEEKITLEYSHSQISQTDIDYITGVYVFDNTDHELFYDYDLGFFTQIKVNGSYSYITGSTVRGDLLYNSSKFIKGDTNIRENIVTFDLKWDDNWKPGGTGSNDDLVDIAVINNIHNDILNNYVYGDDYSVPYNNGLLGIKRTARPYNNKSVFAPDEMSGSGDYNVSTKGLSSHPWYDEDLTFIFGCLDESIFGISLCKFKRTGPKYRWSDIGTSDETKKGWLADNIELDELRFNEIHDTIISECKQKSRLVKCYLEISYGANIYKVNFDDAFNDNCFAVSEEDDYNVNYPNIELFYPDELDSDSIYQDVCRIVRHFVEGSTSPNYSGYIEGISDTGIPIVNVGTQQDPIYIPAETIAVKFKLLEYDVNYEDLGTSGDLKLNKRYKIDLKTTEYTCICNVKFKDNVVTINYNSGNYSQAPTLMPYSVYQPYIHFVDESNIISNGIKYTEVVGGVRKPVTITTQGINNNVDTLGLKYKVGSNVDNSKYKSFFISLVNIGDVIIEGFAYELSNGMHILHSIELDAMLYNINDNIHVYSGSTFITNSAKYYSSGESYPSIAFGNCGFIAWKAESGEDYSNSKLHIKITRNVSNETKHNLIKASEYIKLQSTSNNFVDVEDGFYNSYFCLVKKPSFDLSSSVYVSGNDIYSVDRNASIKLTNFTNYVQVQNSKTYFIRSNFNLNYLNLTEDISDKIFNIGGATSGLKQVAKVINSATLSYIYELKAMYKDFLNKKFSERETEYITEFNNIVRVSNVLSDETFNNSVFKFSAKDYYTIPTDRGEIVSLFSIGNNIFIHTKGSFYKFDANQTIMASDSDITLKEAEPFDAGITQIFDSQYGYGGINNKEAGCITFDSYIFYDSESNHIFAYSGNGQVQLIDGSIFKFLKHYNFKECYTLHDDVNRRVFFEFRKAAKAICLSYNYKAKSFVSIHDITINNAFSTRSKCYSYNDTLCDLFNSTSISTTVLNAALNLRKIYGGASAVSNLFFGAESNFTNASPFGIAIVMYALDNVREVLNNVKYVSDIIKDAIEAKTINANLYDFLTNQEHTYYSDGKAINPVESLYIVTDSCLSNIIEGSIDDTTRVGRDDYKAIRHDVDSWNLNYFRNVLHIDNVVNYPGETGVGSPGQPRVNYNKTDVTPAVIATTHPNSDNHSYVYGRFFIINFSFVKDKPIKFEEIFISTKAY